MEAEDDLPTVSMVIAAYNEAKVIQKKIENFLSLNYPSDKIEFHIGSDGSTDNTNAICKRYRSPRILLLMNKERRGKAAMLNDLVGKSKGEIVVFSDANTMLDRNVVKNLVRHFRNHKIGGVSGRLILNWKDEVLNSAEALYWKYETCIKKMEGVASSVIGANGGIYAIRRNLYRPVDQNTIIDDFVISMNIVKMGYRFSYDVHAVGHEISEDDLKSEFKRKVRIGSGNVQALKHTGSLLMPKYGLISFMFWSHKIFRWCVPILLLCVYILPVFSIQKYPFGLLIVQNTILLMAVFGTKYCRDNRWIKMNTYFFSVNIALLLGYLKYITGRHKVTWEKTR